MAESTLPKTMKAWLVTKNGEPKDALTLRTDYPVPDKVKGGNLLVKVDYAALNPADLNFMANLPNWLPFRHNPVVGLDFAGKVVQLGSDVPANLGISIGSEVAGAFNVMSVTIGRGSLAEYVEVPATKVALKPKALPLRDAAGALGIAGQTAYIMLKEAGTKAGDRVLVNGASGGVGSILVQVAKAKGAVVYGVSSNADLVKSLGADGVINYKEHDSLTSYLSETFSESSKSFHAVFDCVGSDELFRQCSDYLDKNGIFISIVGGAGAGPMVRSKVLPVSLGGVQRRYKLLALYPDGAIAKEVAKWVEEGSYTQFLMDSEYSMGKAVQAYERVASKRSRGKVIVKISD